MQHVRSLAESRGRRKTEPPLLARWENAKYVFDRLYLFLFRVRPSVDSVRPSTPSSSQRSLVRLSPTHTHRRHRRLFLGRFSLL